MFSWLLNLRAPIKALTGMFGGSIVDMDGQGEGIDTIGLSLWHF
jgi:hypothetical protein